MKEELSFRFATLGIFVEDLEFIEAVLKKYDVSLYVISADSASFDSLDELINYAKSNAIKSFFFHGRQRSGSGPLVSLQIIGALSSWEVGLPGKDDAFSTAVAHQMFQEIRSRLILRKSTMAAMPWHIARNCLTWVPLMLLAVKEYSSLGALINDRMIIRLTVTIAVSHAVLAYLERKKYYREAVAKPKKMPQKIKKVFTQISVITLTSVVTVLVEEVLSRILLAD